MILQLLPQSSPPSLACNHLMHNALVLSPPPSTSIYISLAMRFSRLQTLSLFYFSNIFVLISSSSSVIVSSSISDCLFLLSSPSSFSSCMLKTCKPFLCFDRCHLLSQYCQTAHLSMSSPIIALSLSIKLQSSPLP
ncbi:hypothetical protein ACLOJK_012015 [Asimina triloba]